MTPKERLQAALACELPDRTPIMEMAIDWRVIRGLGFRGYFDLIEQLDLDGVSANQVAYLLGLRPLTMGLTRRYTDPWGVRKRLGRELFPTALEHPIRTQEQLRRLRTPDPRRDPLLAAVRATVRRFRGRRAVVLVGQAVFAASWNLCGLTRLLEAYVLEPELALELGRRVLEYNLELHRLAVRAGADAVVLADDYAHKTGPMMSPEHFRRFVLPGLSAAVANVHDAGGACIKHSDGNLWPLLEDILAAGVDALGPLEPGAGMELGEVRRRCGMRVCLVGNVDVDLLCRGTAEEVRRATRALLDRLPGGGHILSSGNSITSGVRPENFKAMVDAARESEAAR